MKRNIKDNKTSTYACTLYQVKSNARLALPTCVFMKMRSHFVKVDDKMIRNMHYSQFGVANSEMSKNRLYRMKIWSSLVIEEFLNVE